MKVMSCRPSGHAPAWWRRGPLRGFLAALVVLPAIAAISSSASSSASAATGTATAATVAATVTVDGVPIAKDPAIASTVPQAVRSKGLVDITDNAYPPDEMVLNGTLTGGEVDLGQAVAAVLGVPWKPTASGAFDSFIPSLLSGRYNTAWGAWIVTTARTKVMNIVSTENVGTGFAAKTGSSAPTLSTQLDLCGHSYAMVVASAFIQQLQAVNAKCKTAGKPSLTVATYPSDGASELAVESGRQEYYVSGASELVWLKHTTAKLTQEPLNFQAVTEGAAVAKTSGLTAPIAAAMNHLIATGAYQAIMRKWGEQAFDIKHSVAYR